MNRLPKTLLLFPFILLLITLIIPNPVHASPAMTTHDSRPTAHATTGGLSVSSPAAAYDNNLGTFAGFRYDPGAAGSFEVKTFTTPASNPIAWVDFKMNYMADAGGSGEQYRIIYYVGTSGPVVLQTWTGAAHAQATDIWLSQSEPIDGVWNWTDVSNIRFVVEVGAGGGGRASDFEEYEAWVTVTTYRRPMMAVDPTSQTDPSSPFSVDVNITSVDDLYSWEFKLYWNKTILTSGSVTEGAFLSNQGSTFFSVLNNTDNYNATHGRIWATCALLGDTVTGASGGGTLATISFTVDGSSGTTPLDLVDTKLVGFDTANRRLANMLHDVTDGSVTISALPEFPLGAALEMALVAVIVYIWWSKRKNPQQLPTRTSVSLR